MKIKNFNGNYAKISFVGVMIFFLLGYYPVFEFPPTLAIVRQNTVQAQEQEITPALLSQSFVLPFPAVLTQGFSSYHPGIDLATSLGTPINPIYSGVVESVQFGIFGYGNHVTVAHPNGYTSMYAHMGRIYVKEGQLVDMYTVLGTVGVTGFTTGPHTHLEVRFRGQLINPITILPDINTYQRSHSLKSVGGNITLTAVEVQPVVEKKSKLPTNLHKSLKPEFE